jgi:tetratricopeptide (TPR) repeat protein
VANQIDIEMQVEDLILESNYKKAKELSEEGLNIFPNSYSLRFHKGQAMLNLGLVVEALVEFEKCSRYSSTLAYPFYYQAQCFSILERNPDFFAALSESIRLDRKIAVEANKNPLFAKHKNNPQFVQILGLPKEIPLDPRLIPVFEMRTTDSEAAFALAKQCLNDISDQASAYDALIDLLDIVIEDIEEHGEGSYSSEELSYNNAIKIRQDLFTQRKKIGEDESAYNVFLKREGKK